MNSEQCPENPKLRAPADIEEKIIHLRTTYHLGQLRIAWYLDRYHGIKISSTGVREVLLRHGLNRIHAVRTNNGHEFQANFHWHVEDLGMQHVYIKPRTPRLNGNVERSHKTEVTDFYQLLTYKDDQDLRAKLRIWEDFYNFQRPHAAHNGKTPFEVLRNRLAS